MVIPKEYLTFSYTCVPVMDLVEGDTNTADPMPLGSLSRTRARCNKGRPKWMRDYVMM